MTRILIIEDEAILRTEVMEWLTLEGFEVISAADGAEGVNLAVLHLPDLIICDISMPRLDGYGVMLDVRTNSLTQLTPFIFMTARASHEDIRRGMSLGADDYITKPFTRLELLQAVQAQLEKRAAQQQIQQRDAELWQQALEQEHQQRMLKTKLVAMFTHDFRNPLAAILSASGLLRDYGHRMDSERQRTHFNRIEASVRQLVQMLDEMLVVSQVETGNLDFNPERLNIAELLQDIVGEFQTIHGETHQLIYTSQFDDPVMADPRLLRQIAANLISNAIKYSPQGREVHTSLESLDGYVVLTVQDHGIGIPEADQTGLFTAFQRASNVGSVSGTGLGLAIVKQAVDLQNGTVHLESQVGTGTTVTVKIPI